MRYVSVENSTVGQALAAHAAVADTFWTRFLGLQGRRTLPAGGGLVLLPTSSIHMFFMRFAIDAVFVRADGVVVRVERGMRPWTSFAVAPGALYCIELPAGAAGPTEPGHRIEVRAAT